MKVDRMSDQCIVERIAKEGFLERACLKDLAC